MSQKLVIVKSPAKAKTINKYLGSDYTVLASYGHIRDLPPKDGSVRPDEDFAMDWELGDRADKPVSEITKAVKNADAVYLASDPDREGEAIAWHILEVLRAKGLAKNGADQARRPLTKSPRKPSPTLSPIRAKSIRIWSMPIWRAARSIIWSAFRCRRFCGANCRAPNRRDACNRLRLRLICERESEIEIFMPQEFWTIEARS